MADPDNRYDRDRGEPPLTMDRQGRERPRGPAPVTLIVSVLLLAIVAGGVFYMYRSGLKSSDGAPRTLGAPLGDVRAPAPASAQSTDAAAGLSIAKDDPNAAGAAPTLAPAPEEPVEPAAPAPSAGAGQTAPASSAALPPPPPPPPPVDDAEAPPTRKAPPQKPESIDHLIARSTGAPPVAATTQPDRAKADAAKAAKADRSKAEAARPERADQGGAIIIQIGAFSSERLADQEWSKAAALAPGVMAGKGKRVVPVSKDGDTLYRTSITGFPSRDQALALCERLRSAGGHCFVH